MNHEFLRLMQMVEAGRKCEGRECIEIFDVDVARAKEIDALESSHLSGLEAGEHQEHSCPECAAVVSQRAVLREGLHSRGVDLPVEVFQPN